MAQLNDLIVTGKSRFLNEINGQIDWSNVLSKPATYAPTIGTTSTTAMAGDTDVNNVTQTKTTTNSDYEILFSGTADNTTRSEGARKTSTLLFNPSKNALTVGARRSGSTIGNYSVVEGIYGTASAMGSHAEGLYTTASGNYSHVEGQYTTAQRRSQHVFGEYNILDTGGSSTSSKGNYIEIVGNGTSQNALSNARTLDWSGNETLAGTLTCTDVTALNTTWDGTNTSLVTAVTSAKGTVTQTATDSTDSNYELLFSGTADNTDRTEGVRKTSGLKFNPSGRNITLTARTVASNYCSFYPTSLSFNSEKYNSSLSNSTIYLDYINDTDHRRMDFSPYGNTFSPCIEISTDDTSGTNFRCMYYTDNDIVLYSGGNLETTWDGTNTSLKTAISSLANRKYIYGSWRETSNKTGTGSSHPTIQSFSFTTTGRPLVIILSAPISVSRYTGSIRLIMDNSGILEASTNSQTMFRATNMIIKTDVAAGTHNFVIDLSAQDAGTTTTLYSYNPYSVMMFEL